TPRAGRMAALVVISVSLLVLVALSPLMLVPSVGVNVYSNLGAARVESKMQVAAMMRPFALPKHEDITAAEAGAALHRVFGTDEDSGEFVERPVAGWRKSLWIAKHPAELFVGTAHDQVFGLPSTSAVFSRARQLNPRELAYLDSALALGDWAD